LLLSGSTDSAPTPPKSFLCKRTLSRLAAARRDRRPLASRQAMGLARIELATSRLSGVRSNQLSYRPVFVPVKTREGKGRNPKIPPAVPACRNGRAVANCGRTTIPLAVRRTANRWASVSAARRKANCWQGSGLSRNPVRARSVVRRTVSVVRGRNRIQPARTARAVLLRSLSAKAECLHVSFAPEANDVAVHGCRRNQLSL
jgi:hypothetical protein